MLNKSDGAEKRRPHLNGSGQPAVRKKEAASTLADLYVVTCS
jgi:hypothetical protein